MKIYTKTGDRGETGLLGGVRVSKSDLAIRVGGEMDELNSWIGLIRGDRLPDDVDIALGKIQNDLFELGRIVAGGTAIEQRVGETLATRIAELEQWIDDWQETLPDLKAFILPGGGRSGGQIHLARAVCRRVERELVELIHFDGRSEMSEALVYLNRLSDLLFVMARFVNFEQNVAETKWVAWR